MGVPRGVLWITTRKVYPDEMWSARMIEYSWAVKNVVGTWTLSTFWLLWIVSLQTFRYRSLCGDVSSFLLGKIRRSRFAGSSGKCLTFRETTKMIPRVAMAFLHFRQQQRSSFFTSSPVLGIVCLFTSTQASLRHSLVVVLCFPGNKWCRASSHVHISHSQSSLVNCSLESLAHF